ncbi:DUF192 domain-containing protein [Spiribacter onubensis]|uniref:DUF192 domain-containing protein n=1 Tax=Spiribacter onubensis TaxID=3122420 RepID=A0ABV3S864_9GAMM
MSASIPDGSIIATAGRGRQSTVCIRVTVADRWLTRLIGLLGTDSPPSPGSGLLLVPGGSVHTLGMRYPIDIATLDATLRVLSQHSSVPPGRFVHAPAGTYATLETGAGILPVNIVGEAFRIEGVAA